MNRKERIFWGVALIAFAVLWIISRLGIIPGIDFGQIGFTALWSAWLIKGIIQQKAFPIFMSTAFLCIVWKEELNIENITPWPVIGAAILLSIGFSLIFGNKEKNKWKKEQHLNKKIRDEKGFGHFESGHVDGENIVHVTKFSGSEKYIDSQNLKSVEIINKFGGSEIYMDKVTAAGTEIYVRIDCLCGGVELYIPSNWKVENMVNVTLGAVVDENGKKDVGAVNDVRMILTGSVILGGVDIIRV